MPGLKGHQQDGLSAGLWSAGLPPWIVPELLLTPAPLALPKSSHAGRSPRHSIYSLPLLFPPAVTLASWPENTGSFPEHTAPFLVPCLTHLPALRAHPLLFGRACFPSDTCLGWQLLWEGPMHGSVPSVVLFATTLWTLQESAYLQDQLIITPDGAYLLLDAMG